MSQKEVKSLRVNPKIWRKAKAQAALEETTLGEFVEEALKEKLEGKENEA